MKTTIEIGQKYGRFTVIAEVARDRHGNRRFRCRCECGSEADYTVALIVGKPNRYCRKCAPHTGGLPKPDFVGKTINGWDVLEDYAHENGIYYFKCRCARCGTVSIKRAGQIRVSKTDRCEHCPPMYDFKVEGKVAIGKLPNGDVFIIDAEDVEKVSQLAWHTDRKGYISHANKPKKRKHNASSLDSWS